MAKTIPYKLFILFGMVFVLFHCAVQGPPTGGPEDKTPPAITKTIPENRAIDVSSDTDIIIVFSEPMNRSSIRSALTIPPLKEDEYSLQWGKNQLTIRFNKPLLKNRTYVVSIGTAAQDLHRNAFSRTESFAFSTGEYIDSGKISGAVFNENGGNAPNSVIYAFSLENNHNPNPFTDAPDYVTQTGNDGKFSFSYLRMGTYRMFAFTSSTEGTLYSEKSSPELLGINFRTIGFPQADIPIAGSDSLTIPVYFLPAVIDTVPPLLYSVESLDSRHVRVHFTEAVSSGSILKECFRIYHLPDNTEVENAVRSYSYDVKTEKTITLFVSNLTPGFTYRLDVSGIVDYSGNVISAGRTGRGADSTGIFLVSLDPDTAQFLLEQIQPQDSSTNVLIYAPITLSFNSGVDFQRISQTIRIADAKGAAVSGAFTAVHPSIYRFQPDKPFTFNTTYRIVISADSLKSVEEKPLYSEKTTFTFTTADPMNTGIISGTVSAVGDSASFPIIIALFPVGALRAAADTRNAVVQTVSADGHYVFEGILPGEYTVMGFIDRDGNGIWTCGRINPFAYSEPFALYPPRVLGVSVRPGIENTGINLTIPVIYKK